MIMKKAFTVCLNKGFHLNFDNGLTLSSQFGYGNYCENRTLEVGDVGRAEAAKSDNCEIAIWNKDGDWITREMAEEVFDDPLDDDVMGYVDFSRWLRVVDWCRNFKA